MKFLLVVVFNFGGPQMQFADGFFPLQFETYAECEAKRQEMREYFILTKAPPFDLACYSREARGVDG